MAADPNAVEQAVSRTLRDNLEKILRTAEELQQAVNDLVSACASSRPSNTLPPMIRAQTSAASLSATFEVLSHFVTSSLQSTMRSPIESELLRVAPISDMATGVAPAPLQQRTPAIRDRAVPPPASQNLPIAPIEQPEPVPPHPMTEAHPILESGPQNTMERVPETVHDSPWIAPAPVEPVFETPAVSEAPLAAEVPAIPSFQPPLESPVATELSAVEQPALLNEPVPVVVHVPVLEPGSIFGTDAETEVQPQSVSSEASLAFRLDSLTPEEQELHRRAFRVAKVSMQDIKMLRPEDVRLGRENRDLCFRLRDDIEKAHREYDRRFQSIQSHPVDYFYNWMVEILAGGDARALGEYPYPSPVLRR